jgi:hypothetical protein
MKKNSRLMAQHSALCWGEALTTILCLSLTITMVVAGASAEAQQPTKMPRIGWLSGSSLSAITTRSEAFRQGLRELGYFEDKNIIVEWRYGEGKPDRVSEFAAELVRLNVDVIVSAGPTPTRLPNTRQKRSRSSWHRTVILLETDSLSVWRVLAGTLLGYRGLRRT